MTEELERFLALVRRELGCDDVSVVDAADVTDVHDGSGGAQVIAARVPDGRQVLAKFRDAPEDAQARQRRLEMLVTTFDDLFDETAEARRTRPPVATSLQDELLAVCSRAAALNAMVIDANSPVVWGAAFRRGLLPRSPDDSAIVGVDDEPANDASPQESRVLLASRRALGVARGWEDLAALRRGKRLRRVEREGEAPLLAHSFAGIYVLLLVFGGTFDELRAERAVLDALPRVERLVLALPPLDPEPSHGAGALAVARHAAVRKPPKR